MRIAYVVYGEILAPVVRSQTFPLLARLREEGHETLLVAVVSPRRFLARSRYREALAAAAAHADKCAVVTHLPKGLAPGTVARRLRGLFRRFRPDIVHARQARAAVAALRAGGAPVLADLRGIRPEEYLVSLGRPEEALDPVERRRLAELRDDERSAREGAAAIVCVSEPFRERLGGGERVFTIPNAADPVPAMTPDERAVARAGMGFGEHDTVLVYSGSLAAWQCARETARLAARLMRERSDVRFALLTHDLAAGQDLVRSEGVEGAAVRSLSPLETRRLLPAFDVAALLRARHPVNEVASPVKFAEYLAAGLPVVLTRGIGDASRWVAEEGLGVVLEAPEDEDGPRRTLSALSSLDGERCRRFATERLSFEATFPRWMEAYACATR